MEKDSYFLAQKYLPLLQNATGYYARPAIPSRTGGAPLMLKIFQTFVMKQDDLGRKILLGPPTTAYFV